MLDRRSQQFGFFCPVFLTAIIYLFIYSPDQSQRQNHQNLAQNMLEAINKDTKATSLALFWYSYYPP